MERKNVTPRIAPGRNPQASEERTKRLLLPTPARSKAAWSGAWTSFFWITHRRTANPTCSLQLNAEF